MKKRKLKFHFEFNIPDFLPTKYELRLYYNTFKHFFKPYRCVDTGKCVPFKFTEIEWHGKGLRRMILSIHTPLSREAFAARCREAFAKPITEPEYPGQKEGLHFTKCDCCGNDRPTLGIGEHKSRFDFRLCMQWWNDFRACEECMINTIEKGAYISGQSALIRGKTYYLNSAGALVKRQQQLTDEHTIVPNPNRPEW